MNRDEWNQFKDRLFTAFPGFLGHINGKSPNPKGTLETWFETLRNVSMSEANAVLLEWQTGAKDPPKAFELDYVAIVIRSRVGGMRDSESKYRTAKTLYEEKQAVVQRRRAYEALIPDMVEAFEIACKAAKRMEAGEITKQQYDQICRDAVFGNSLAVGGHSTMTESILHTVPMEANQ